MRRTLTATRPAALKRAVLCLALAPIVGALAACGSGTSTTGTASASATATSASSDSASSSESESASPTTEDSAGTETSASSTTSQPSGDDSTTGGPLGESFEAFGTEPFWNVSVDGSTLYYTQPDQPDRTLTATRSGSADEPVYKGTSENTEFTLTVTDGECGDGMSDNTFTHKATFRYGEIVLSGCAGPSD